VAVSDAATPEDRVETLTEELIEQTGRDPALGPKERETVVRFATDEGDAHIHTEEPALVRRLLAHAHTTVEELRVVADGGEKVRYVTPDDAAADGGVDGRVVSLRGRLPVACLTVATVPRKNAGHADVVSKGVFDE
jgi:hypothetical protein